MLAFDCSQVPRTPSSGRLEEKLITVRKGTCSEVVQKVKKKKKKSLIQVRGILPFSFAVIKSSLLFIMKISDPTIF